MSQDVSVFSLFPERRGGSYSTNRKLLSVSTFCMIKHAGKEARIIVKTVKAEKSGKIKGDMDMNIKRGDIYYADLSPVVGSEQGGLRPVLIVQNDVGNRYSPTVIAAAITSKMGKARLPTHIDIYAKEVGLAKDSVILLEQVRTLDKRRLREKMGHLEENTMQRVNTAISVSFGLTGNDERDGRVYTSRKIEENNT